MSRPGTAGLKIGSGAPASGVRAHDIHMAQGDRARAGLSGMCSTCKSSQQARLAAAAGPCDEHRHARSQAHVQALPARRRHSPLSRTAPWHLTAWTGHVRETRQCL